MTYRIEIKPSAQKELAKIPKTSALKIIDKINAHLNYSPTDEKIKSLAKDPRPSGCKKLTGTDHSFRVRIGNNRVVYSIFDDRLIIQVIKIGHRKDVYK